MNILTGNDLKTGAVIWWTGVGWSLDVNDSADVGEDGAAIIAREEAARKVFASYVVDGVRTDEGVRPSHIKERIRALGPTVRPDRGTVPSAAPAERPLPPAARLHAARRGALWHAELGADEGAGRHRGQV